MQRLLTSHQLTSDRQWNKEQLTTVMIRAKGKMKKTKMKVKRKKVNKICTSYTNSRCSITRWLKTRCKTTMLSKKVKSRWRRTKKPVLKSGRVKLREMVIKKRNRKMMTRVMMELKVWSNKLKSNQRIKAMRMIRMMGRTRRWKSLKELRMMHPSLMRMVMSLKASTMMKTMKT